MSSIAVSGANCVLSYRSSGTHTAKLRCNGLSTGYRLNSSESHARQHRAFYPKRRSQGGFALKFECNGQKEANALAQWLRDYARAALNLAASDVPPPMSVSVPSRDFLRLGIPTVGIQFGDHLGSMVFTPTIQFVSVSDPEDPSTSVLKRNQASGLTLRGTDPASNAFYPTTVVKRPGKLGDQIYAPADPAPPSSQQLSDAIIGNSGTANGRKEGMSF